MATEEKNISAIAELVSPSVDAAAIVYDPNEVLPQDRTRMVKLTVIGEQRVLLTTGSPEGVITTNGPALAISAAGALWARPVATPGNTGWIQLLA